MESVASPPLLQHLNTWSWHQVYRQTLQPTKMWSTFAPNLRCRLVGDHLASMMRGQIIRPKYSQGSICSMSDWSMYVCTVCLHVLLESSGVWLTCRSWEYVKVECSSETRLGVQSPSWTASWRVCVTHGHSPAELTAWTMFFSLFWSTAWTEVFGISQAWSVSHGTTRWAGRSLSIHVANESCWADTAHPNVGGEAPFGAGSSSVSLN